MVLSSCMQDEEETWGLGEVQRLKDMHMVIKNGDYTESWGHQWREGFDLAPFCSLPPHPEMGVSPSKWVLNKVREIQDCVGTSREGFEEQFQALLIVIESSCSPSTKSMSRHD